MRVANEGQPTPWAMAEPLKYNGHSTQAIKINRCASNLKECSESEYKKKNK